VPLDEASCEVGSACADTVSDKQVKRLKNKKEERVSKRIIKERLEWNGRTFNGTKGLGIKTES